MPAEQAKKSQRNPLAQPHRKLSIVKLTMQVLSIAISPSRPRTSLCNRDGFESRGHRFLAQRRRLEKAEKAAQNSRSNALIYEEEPWERVERLSKPRTRHHREEEMQSPSPQELHETPPPASPAVSDDAPIDVHVEYHPSENSASSDFRLEDFRQPAPQNIPPPSSNIMYRPFNTKSEFLFAQIAIGASLTHDHIQTLCDIINRCISGQDYFTIKSAKEFEDRLKPSSSIPTD
ncbi:hypothetical protein Agabi119p4_10771 [Agaricus bisporus var. burnettii]|uniref:Uncharacterized protein n=1 Tax=Agaricus bisporus var. burnettii TaxID=192524 RepID=A0A8H7C157_AGABI|nr:hypothetical protein Agabi119p4_10771 [Agaricus bisporus var. burnettii]